MNHELRILNAPQFRRAELLDLLSSERGLLIGWEERGLFTYAGPDTHRRLYSTSDYLRMGIAKRAIQWGVAPKDIWILLNDHPEIVLGKQQYAVYNPIGPHEEDLGISGMWQLSTEDNLNKTIAERLKLHGWVEQIIVVDLYRILNDTVAMLFAYFRDKREEMDRDVSSVLKQIAQRIEEGLQIASE